MLHFIMDEGDVEHVLKHPLSMIGSDGSSLRPEGPLGRGKPHPRSYGCFPRVLAHYVRERRLLSLEEAVRKMTSAPATRLGLKGKGLLRWGMDADLVVFDPQTVRDAATFAEPHRTPKGSGTSSWMAPSPCGTESTPGAGPDASCAGAKRPTHS